MNSVSEKKQLWALFSTVASSVAKIITLAQLPSKVEVNEWSIEQGGTGVPLGTIEQLLSVNCT